MRLVEHAYRTSLSLPVARSVCHSTTQPTFFFIIFFFLFASSLASSSPPNLYFSHLLRESTNQSRCSLAHSGRTLFPQPTP